MPSLRCSENDVLVVALAIGHEQTVVVGIKEVVACALHAVVLARGSFNRREELALVVAVEMDLVGVAVGLIALEALADDVRLAGDGAQGGNPIVVAHEFVGDCAGFDVTGPAHEARHAEGAFPVGVLLRAEGCHGAVGPGVHVRAVVGGVDDDRVIGDAHVVERFEQRADGVVVLDHAVDVFAVAVLVAAAMLGADVRAQMHARGVAPAEERLARIVLALHEVDRGG